SGRISRAGGGGIISREGGGRRANTLPAALRDRGKRRDVKAGFVWLQPEVAVAAVSERRGGRCPTVACQRRGAGVVIRCLQARAVRDGISPRASIILGGDVDYDGDDGARVHAASAFGSGG